jgi:hypothetical protein
VLQEQVFEHVRACLAELDEERRWDASFKRMQDSLVVAARKAKAEIAAGLATPIDYE